MVSAPNQSKRRRIDSKANARGTYMTIADILQRCGVNVREVGQHHHASQGRVQIDCPWCSPDTKHFRMGIHKEKLYCSCYVCGFHNLLKTLAEVTGQSYQQLKSWLGNISPEIIKEAPRGKLTLPHGIGPLLPAHKSYLKRRGFDPDELERFWGIRGIGVSSKFSWHLWIPIHHQGEVVSWTTRSLLDQGGRYKNAKPEEEKIRMKNLLYAEEFVRHTVIVCEGCFDAIRVGPGAVATMGMEVTREQVLRLSKYPVRVVAFDSEPLAQRRARQLCQDLEPFPGRTYRVELSGKDPASSPKQEIKYLRSRFL